MTKQEQPQETPRQLALPQGLAHTGRADRPIAEFRFQLDSDVSAEVLFRGNLLSSDHIEALIDYLKVAQKRVFKKDTGGDQ